MTLLMFLTFFFYMAGLQIGYELVYILKEEKKINLKKQRESTTTTRTLSQDEFRCLVRIVGMGLSWSQNLVISRSTYRISS